MSHDILEDRYVGSQPAWYGIGTVLDRAFTAEEAIRYAKLDYEVVKVPMYLQDGQGADMMATVNSELPVGNPDRILGYVGLDYEVVQNVEAFEFFDTVVDREDAVYESVGVLDKGKRIFIVAKIPEQFIIKDDIHDQYITLATSHDASFALKVFATTVRVVCANTLSMALGSTKSMVYLRHTRTVRDRMGTAAEILGLATKEFRRAQAIFQQLADKRVTTRQFEEFVEAIFPSQGERVNQPTQDHRASVHTLFDAPTNSTPGIRHTWYAAVNAVGEYVDHNMPYRKLDRSAEALFGRGAQIKTKALNYAARKAKA